MDIVDELIRVVNAKRYYSITFYLNTVPIITINFGKDKKITVLVNNMKEIRSHEVEFNGDVDTFVSDMYNILVYSGIDELIQTTKDPKVTFYSEPYLHGTISKDGITVELDEVDFGDRREPNMVHKKYEINADVQLSGLIIPKIASAFAYLRFT